MVQIRLMPAGGEEAIQHLYDTIINKVSKDKIKNFFSEEEFSKLNSIYGEREFPIWGFEPGKVNNKVWEEELNIGDILIFVPSNEDLIVTKLIYKIKNRELANELWGVSKRSNQIWELILFLEILGCINLEKRNFLNKLGYSDEIICREAEM